MVTLAAALIMGCGKEDVQVYKSPKAEAKPVAHGDAHGVDLQHGATHEHSPYDSDLPSGWVSQSASGMRLISFKVPVGEASLDGSVVQLNVAGGDVVSNVNRWRGQVALAPADSKDIMAEMKEFDCGLGKFKYFKLINPENPKSAILVSMITVDQMVVFTKLMGPMEPLIAQEANFLAFCRSLRPHKH